MNPLGPCTYAVPRADQCRSILQLATVVTKQKGTAAYSDVVQLELF